MLLQRVVQDVALTFPPLVSLSPCRWMTIGQWSEEHSLLNKGNPFKVRLRLGCTWGFPREATGTLLFLSALAVFISMYIWKEQLTIGHSSWSFQWTLKCPLGKGIRMIHHFNCETVKVIQQWGENVSTCLPSMQTGTSCRATSYLTCLSSDSWLPQSFGMHRFEKKVLFHKSKCI